MAKGSSARQRIAPDGRGSRKTGRSAIALGEAELRSVGQISGRRKKMDQTSINREFVKHHFEAVNRRDVPTVLGNMRPDLYDHELPGDHKNDLQEGAQRLRVLMKQVPDLRVDVRDVIADGDKVVVRAIWLGTDAATQRKVEFHGFVQWRIVEGKFAERWATVTSLAELPEGMNAW